MWEMAGRDINGRSFIEGKLQEQEKRQQMTRQRPNQRLD